MDSRVTDSVVDMNPLDSLYVYCEVVEPQVVGDGLTPLLRIVPVEGEHGELVTRIYTNVHYVRAKRKMIQTLEVNIRDHTGKKVPFERGTLNVTLQFRRSNVSSPCKDATWRDHAGICRSCLSERIWHRSSDEKHVEGGHSPPETSRWTGGENWTFSGGQWHPR